MLGRRAPGEGVVWLSQSQESYRLYPGVLRGGGDSRSQSPWGSCRDLNLPRSLRSSQGRALARGLQSVQGPCSHTEQVPRQEIEQPWPASCCPSSGKDSWPLQRVRAGHQRPSEAMGGVPEGGCGIWRKSGLERPTQSPLLKVSIEAWEWIGSQRRDGEIRNKEFPSWRSG